MRELRSYPILFGCLALILSASLLAACDEEEVVPPPAETVLASGIVLDMPLSTPLAEATVQLITNTFLLDDPDYVAPCECEPHLCSFNTTSDEDGYWEMEVPVEYTEMWAPLNMLMKVSKGTGPPQYNLFQPGGTNEGDLQRLSAGFYAFFALTSGTSPLELIAGQASVFLGVAIGFVDMDYPQEIVTIPGVAVTAEGGDPEVEFPIAYLGGQGETGDLGVFYFSVPDANEADSIQVTGEKPGSVFVGGFYPACPGSSTGAAVIDPYYQP